MAQADAWYAERFVPERSDLPCTLANNADRRLPAHDVSALAGECWCFIKMIRAVCVPETGTPGGYSKNGMAKALPPTQA